MTRDLRQNTATRVTVGPFLDLDGLYAITSLTATDEKLTFIVDTGGVPTLVIDATATASGGNNDLVHITNDDAGYYDLELTAAQTNYVGRAMLSIQYGDVHRPVTHEFNILPAPIYDAKYGLATTSAGTASALICSSLSATAYDRLYRGQVITFTSGTYSGSQHIATTYNSSTTTLDFSPALPGTVGSGVSFVLSPHRAKSLSNG